jgi:hypothetical protein
MTDDQQIRLEALRLANSLRPGDGTSLVLEADVIADFLRNGTSPGKGKDA